MSPSTWWTQVITSTLAPALSKLHITDREIETSILPNLSNLLLERFSSKEGYSLHEDSYLALNSLLESKTHDSPGSRTIVGVISNSDPRVRPILRSCGLQVSDVGAGTKPPFTTAPNDHIQFVVLSYDVGYRKPSPEIFKVAEDVARSLLPEDERSHSIEKIYVGDDVEKDGVAAVNAGWESFIVDRSVRESSESQNLERFHRLSSLFPLPASILPESRVG
jgi:hypothetical protein